MPPSLPPLAAPAPFQPRSGRLITAGILLVLSGCVFGCLTALTPMSLAAAPSHVAPSHGATDTQQIGIVVAMYLAVTLLLFVLATGALLPRRWCRPLIMLVATHWLIAGAILVVGLLAMLPLVAGMSAGGGEDDVAMKVAIGALLLIDVVAAVLGIGLPVTLLMLVRSEDVRHTLKVRDPKPRWTDNCPPKLIGLAGTLVLAAALVLLTALQPMLPVLGFVLTGLPALAAVLTIAIVLLFAAVKCFQRRRSGWWLGLAGVVLPMLACIPNAWQTLPASYYASLGLPREEISLLTQHGDSIRTLLVCLPLIFSAAFTLYMLRLRKVFNASIDAKLNL